MENIDKVIRKLKGIIFILQESTANYLSASENVDDPKIKESLLIYSRERSFYQLQLQDEIDRMGEHCKDFQEEALKQKNQPNNKHTFSLSSFLTASIQAETELIDKYKSALTEITFFSALSLLVQNQLSGIEKSLALISNQQTIN